jgi:hypothetical protein
MEAYSALSTIQFLAWVVERPRRYADVQEAWRSSCPRLSVWEDALGDGLVQCEQAKGKAASDSAVTLTAKGRALLEAAPRAGENAPPARHLIAAD